MTTEEPTPGSSPASVLERQHADVLGGGRGGRTSGWIVKILLLGATDAIVIAGLTMAIDHEAWGYVAVLAISLVAFNVVYLPRRFIPMKYLLPGLFFLAVFGIYPVLYTAYASTTNYGTGHVLSKSQAIDQIQSQSVRPVEGATRYDITPLEDADGVFAGFALFDPEAEQLFLGTDTELTELDLADAQLTTLATTGRTFVESVDDLTGVRAGDVRTLPGYPDPDAYQMPGESEDAAITISGGQAVESQTTRIYDADAGTITDVAQDPPVVYRDVDGFFVADGDPPTQLSPGFTTRCRVRQLSRKCSRRRSSAGRSSACWRGTSCSPSPPSS